jgi:hypothetical protein
VSNERKADILHLASKFLEEMREPNTIPDEVEIDSAFILRFDPICVQQIHRIRQTMHALLGQAGEASFTQDDGWRLYFHLERHWEMRITNDLSQANQIWRFELPQNWGYRPLLNDDGVNWITLDEQTMKDDPQRRGIVREALQTSKVVDDINRLAFRFGLLPDARERTEYAPIELQRLWQCIVRWVIFDDPMPRFFRPITRIAELREKGFPQWLHASQPLPVMTDRLSQKGKAPLMPDTRVRTWAIYYLTRRGGGDLIEEEACALMNVPVQAYHKQRQKLFALGSKKRIR